MNPPISKTKLKESIVNNSIVKVRFTELKFVLRSTNFNESGCHEQPLMGTKWLL